ncbi:MAG: PVC-type heme-binding CxxCH protein [Pirellulaceae bacterium]
MKPSILRYIFVLHLLSIFAFTTARLVSAQEPLFSLAKFDIDVTPPVGFPMAYDRVRRTDELTLRCRGIVLFGPDKPIVMCAVDWIGIANGAHDAFRKTLAEAAGTSADRVAVHTLHQHDAPRCDFTAESLLNAAGATDLGALEGSFARRVLADLGLAVRTAVQNPVAITHAGIGGAKVEKVASNRRIQDETGKVIATRYTACRDPELRALPEGIIDPTLKAISFWNENEPVAVLTYYACHPQSYYRTGIPSPDFPGIARFLRGQDMPETLHVHFNGAGGNIGAGKYNDGSKQNRMILARRMAEGMRDAFAATKKFSLQREDVGWFSTPVHLPLGSHLEVDELRKQLGNWTPNEYWGGPEQLAWALRCESEQPIELSCLRIGDARILHMPGELFVEYQLAAQNLRPDLTVAMAAYGDYGPGYIGTDESYGQGGYETSPQASKVAKGVEQVLMKGVRELLDAADKQVGNFKDELPRIPPSTPDESLSKIEVIDGYSIQLVASEPLVFTPVAMEWDAAGNLFVCEMRGYSEDREAGISSIALLTDVDQDGIYDRRTEYASGLLWPTCLFPYDGGLFVGDAPNLFYLKDTDGDGVADAKEVVLTGFGVSNVQGLMNSMRWGLDHRIHLACSSSGGKVYAPARGQTQADAVEVRGRDLAFDPRTMEFELTSGGAQHGMCFDDWGNKFVCSNSNHLMQVMAEQRYLNRNPHVRAPPAKISIAADGPQAEVFRKSPVEPWRVVRTRLRVEGHVGGPIEGGGRAAGYFTGATGATVYRGDAWPDDANQFAFIGDVGSNLVHRKKLLGDGVPFNAVRVDEGTEFLRSTDNWFRPSQFANGPDGALYIIDTCREVIEHPKSLPPEIKQHLDLTAGRDRGRIYRVVPKSFQHRPAPNIQELSIEQLVALLEHPNAWHRETAARLINERQDPNAFPWLIRLLQTSSSPQAKIHALYALATSPVSDKKGTLREQVLKLLEDDHPQVRRHAVRISERANLATELAEAMLPLATDPSLAVRLQLAFSLGELPIDTLPRERTQALATILRLNPNHTWVQVAVQSSAKECAAELFSELIQDLSPSQGKETNQNGVAFFLERLAQQIKAQQRPNDIASALNTLAQSSSANAPAMLPLIGELLGAREQLDGTEHQSTSESARRLESERTKLIQEAAARALSSQLTLPRRTEAARALRYGQFADVEETLSRLLGPAYPTDLQLAAIDTLKSFPSGSTDSLLIANVPGMSPIARNRVMSLLLSRERSMARLLDAIEAETVRVDSSLRSRLVERSSGLPLMLAKRLEKLLQQNAMASRTTVLDSYATCLDLPPDRDNGRRVFQKHCAACHRHEDEGYELGPSLAAMKSRGARSLLTNILDPNREVNPEFVNYLAITKDGNTVSGMIRSESATELQLVAAANEQTRLPRSDIDQLRSTGKSLMPEGFESSIDLQSMADLIAFLLQTAQP